ncbi:hypothetical protein [Ralstonia pseudosolanacearum]|uniref:hypothetical protein n=1 Tax=Ralstonia pseudosolanacearum TaxID=1310165 RepID=UPI001FFAC722|nr:hypothetical protein [Ralstonia pseudosolanacearum]
MPERKACPSHHSPANSGKTDWIGKEEARQRCRYRRAMDRRSRLAMERVCIRRSVMHGRIKHCIRVACTLDENEKGKAANIVCSPANGV